MNNEAEHKETCGKCSREEDSINIGPGKKYKIEGEALLLVWWSPCTRGHSQDTTHINSINFTK